MTSPAGCHDAGVPSRSGISPGLDGPNVCSWCATRRHGSQYASALYQHHL